MGRIRKILIGAGMLVAVLGLSAGVVLAANDASISGTTDHTIYKFGRSVTISGVVNGDVICGAQTVSIDATVNGDIICAGQTVTINGTVHGNVRAAGQTVNVNAKIERNASIAGQDATLQSSSEVGQDLGVAGQSATVNGLVGRDIRGASETLTLTSSVGRDVEANVNNLDIGQDAKIARNLKYSSPNKINSAKEAAVGGKVDYHKAQAKKKEGVSWRWRVFYLAAKVALGVVFVALLPQLFRRWDDYAATNYGWAWAILVGFIGMFAVPVVIIAFAATVVGIPIAIFLMLLWLVLLFPSAVTAMYFVGARLAGGLHPLLFIIIGALVLGILEMVPYLGVLVFMLAYWFGTGNLLINLKRSYQKPTYNA